MAIENVMKKKNRVMQFIMENWPQLILSIGGIFALDLRVTEQEK